MRPIFCAFLIAGSCALLLTASAETQSAEGFEYTLRLGYTRHLSDAELAWRMDKAKDAGATTMKVMPAWDHVEPTANDQYYWGHVDRVLSFAEARGLKVSVQIHGTPDWVHPNLYQSVPNFSDRVWYPPKGETELAYWRDLLYDMVSRYGTRINRYELWNEPNHSHFWRPAANPAEFMALQRAGYVGAKQANPNVMVTSGGLSGNDVGFLNATYDEIAKYPDARANNNFFDELGVHPYSAIGWPPPMTPLAPDEYTQNAVWQGKWGTVNNNYLGFEKMKAVMDARGDSHKRIFLGEYGFSHVQTWMQSVPDETRARYLERAYALAKERSNYVSGLSWYSYVEDPEWRIVDESGNESLTFQAFRQATGAEVPAEPVSVAVNSLYTDKTSYKRNSTVYATALLESTRDATLERAVMAARKRSTGRNFDFPARYDFPVSTTGATLESSRVFHRRGTYNYWAAYYQNGSWHNLTPKKSFTVR